MSDIAAMIDLAASPSIGIVESTITECLPCYITKLHDMINISLAGQLSWQLLIKAMLLW
jgi:hypothetical protein